MEVCLITGENKGFESSSICNEFEKRGINYKLIKIRDIEILVNKLTRLKSTSNEDISTFDAFLIRIGNYKIPYLYRQLSFLKKFIYEPEWTSGDKMPEYMTLANNGLPVPKTFFLGKYNTEKTHILVENYISEFNFPLIIKATNGSKGEWVFKCNSKEQIYEVMKKDPHREFLMQELLGNKEDIRVIALDGKILGGMLKKAQGEEFRTNVAQGGVTEVFEVNEEISKIVLKACKILNINFAGVDIILDNGKPYILEVNNVPQFEGFQKVTNINVAEKLIDVFVKKYNNFISSL